MKIFGRVSLGLVFVASSNAFPFAKWFKRQTLADMSSVDILNYALTLEHLEATFYRQGIANFSSSDFTKAGFDSSVYSNIQRIAFDESSHIDFLTSALGAINAPAVKECTYNFGALTPNTFLATASILEGVGVSAYLGAAAQIASNPTYLTAAGSILTVEARHNAYIRNAIGQIPFAQAFDVPLTPDEVHTLAHGFITSCPTSNPPLKVHPFPGLVLGSGTKGQIVAGDVVEVDTIGYQLKPANSRAKLYAAFVSVTGPVWTNVTEVQGSGGLKFSVTIPKGVEGQSYLVFTGCSDAVTDDTVVAGPALVEISG